MAEVFQSLGWKQDLDYYVKARRRSKLREACEAAQMMSAKYGVELVDEPIFLTWVGAPYVSHAACVTGWRCR